MQNAQKMQRPKTEKVPIAVYWINFSAASESVSFQEQSELSPHGFKFWQVNLSSIHLSLVQENKSLFSGPQEPTKKH